MVSMIIRRDTRLIVVYEGQTEFQTNIIGRLRAMLLSNVVAWLNANVSDHWHSNQHAYQDAVILTFDYNEDAIAFKLAWM